MISALQHRMPTSDMMVRMRLRIRFRTIILVLKSNLRHKKPMRSSRMRLPALGGLGLSSSAVVSLPDFWYVYRQMQMLMITVSAASPHEVSETGG